MPEIPPSWRMRFVSAMAIFEKTFVKAPKMWQAFDFEKHCIPNVYKIHSNLNIRLARFMRSIGSKVGATKTIPSPEKS